MSAEQPRYLAYLVRLWEVETEGESIWRASAQCPHTGERYAFADLERLYAFLKERTGREAAVPFEGSGGETSW